MTSSLSRKRSKPAELMNRIVPTYGKNCDPSGLCESGIILLIINLLLDVIEKQCTTVCTTFSALFWRAKLP